MQRIIPSFLPWAEVPLHQPSPCVLLSGDNPVGLIWLPTPPGSHCLEAVGFIEDRETCLNLKDLYVTGFRGLRLASAKASFVDSGPVSSLFSPSLLTAQLLLFHLSSRHLLKF